MKFILTRKGRKQLNEALGDPDEVGKTMARQTKDKSPMIGPVTHTESVSFPHIYHRSAGFSDRGGGFSDDELPHPNPKNYIKILGSVGVNTKNITSTPVIGGEESDGELDEIHIIHHKDHPPSDEQIQKVRKKYHKKIFGYDADEG